MEDLVKVGSILTYIRYGEVDPVEENGGAEIKQVRSYVYKRDDDFFYFTRSGTRVLVVDKKKVDFFPDGVEPDEMKGTIMDFFKPPPPPNSGSSVKFLHDPHTKIGYITVFSRKQDEEDDEKWITQKEKRIVYTNESAFIPRPFYLTDSGNKVIVVDTKRIEYIDPEKEAPK